MSLETLFLLTSQAIIGNMLSVQHLHKSFGGIKAVNDCSFEIKPHQITALIGPNGAGKTTVFNLISGFLKPDSGSVWLENHNLSKLEPEQIAQLGLARVFQQNRLFSNLSVQENLLLALQENDANLFSSIQNGPTIAIQEQDQIKEMLQFVGLPPHYRHTLTSELSFGQKRLVELARTLLRNHSLLLLDEPLAGVTPKLRIEIRKILEKLREQNETILLIEHDMTFTLSVSDHIIVMDEGRVIAEGKPNEIKNNPKVLEAYLGD